jgi:Protein of unknown function (DUF2934)
MTTSNGEASNGTAKKRKPAAKKVKAVAAPTPTHDQIAALAEKYWAERGWPQGSPEQDWLRAEDALRTA